MPDGVQQDDRKDGYGQPQCKALGEIPINPFESHGQQEHQNGTDPNEGGEEEQQQDQGSRQSSQLKVEQTQSRGFKYLFYFISSRLSSHLQSRTENQQENAASHGQGESEIQVLVVLPFLVAIPKPQRDPAHVCRLVPVHAARLNGLR